MPILEVDIVLRDGESLGDDVIQALADGAGKIFQTGPGKTWIKASSLSGYAENEILPGNRPFPVFVKVLLRRLPDKREKMKLSRQLAEKFAPILDRSPDNIHILFLPEAQDSIAFGGKL